MFVSRIALRDFRNYGAFEAEFAPQGLTVIHGVNGAGKTNLLEAIHYASTLRSFRATSLDVLIRNGCDSAFVRSTAERDGREVLIEAEISATARSRAMVNKQPTRRGHDELLPATVFSPEDLELVKKGPSLRRDYLDEILAMTSREATATQASLEKVLRQRNTLLRQASGRITSDIATTLDVWDARFASFGETLGDQRDALVKDLSPLINDAYAQLAGISTGGVVVTLRTNWRLADGGPGLARALVDQRATDISRGVTTVGPHRDDLELMVAEMPARTHSSQGEQRTLALAMRLAAHVYVTERFAEVPLLLLDDVLSELDEGRAERLMGSLALGQAFLTTALPPARVEGVVDVIDLREQGVVT